MPDDYLSRGRVQHDLKILKSAAPTQPGSYRTSEDMYLKGYGRHWGEKITYNMGMAYGTAFLYSTTGGLASIVLPPEIQFLRNIVAGAVSGLLYKIAASGRIRLIYTATTAGVSAAISKTAVAPIERVKLVLQTQDVNLTTIAGQAPKYKGLVGTLAEISKNQGVISLWRGNMTNVVRYFPTQAFNFAFKDTFKSLFPAYNPSTEFWKFSGANIASGGLAGAASLAIVYPLDFARTRLAADTGVGGAREFKGFFHCVGKVSKRSGISSLYKGFGVSVQGIVVYRGAYFGLYDTAKSVIFKNTKKPSVVYKWMVAQFVTSTAGIISYPFDTVRRRLMLMSGRDKSQIQYRGTLDCWRKIARTEGVSAFFKGAWSNVVRGAGGAMVLVLYDEMQRVLHQ